MSVYPELSETLIALVESVVAADLSGRTGLIVTRAQIDAPLEGYAVQRGGSLVILGSVPHSRWKAGFLPPAHRGHLEIVLIEEDPDEAVPMTSRKGNSDTSG